MKNLIKTKLLIVFCAALMGGGLLTACNSTITSGTGAGGNAPTTTNQNNSTVVENKTAENKAPAKPTPEKQTSELPEFKKDEDYGKVREKMLTAGWTPHRSKDADKCGKGDERCQGRPEMQSCAGTGMANCKFVWKKGEKMLAIFTVGDPAVYSGHEFESAKPESKTTDKPLPPRADNTMIGPARVFSPPSNIRVSPDGKVLCKVEKEILIELHGSTNIRDDNGFWIYTDYCGKMGVIHSTQINIAS